MNAEVKKKWIEALRGGKYEQLVGGLKSGDKYCCLAVLNDLCPLGDWNDDNMYVVDGFTFIDDSDEPDDYPEEEFLHPKVREWAGLSEAEPSVTFRYVTDGLAQVNDAGVSFARIADLIEEQL